MRSNKKPQNCNLVSLKFVLLGTTYNFFHTTMIIFASLMTIKPLQISNQLRLATPSSPMSKGQTDVGHKGISQHELKLIPKIHDKKIG